MKNKDVYTLLEQFRMAASMFGGFSFVALTFTSIDEPDETRRGEDGEATEETIFLFQTLAFASFSGTFIFAWAGLLTITLRTAITHEDEDTESRGAFWSLVPSALFMLSGFVGLSVSIWHMADVVPGKNIGARTLAASLPAFALILSIAIAISVVKYFGKIGKDDEPPIAHASRHLENAARQLSKAIARLKDGTHALYDPKILMRYENGDTSYQSSAKRNLEGAKMLDAMASTLIEKTRELAEVASEFGEAAKTAHDTANKEFCAVGRNHQSEDVASPKELNIASQLQEATERLRQAAKELNVAAGADCKVAEHAAQVTSKLKVEAAEDMKAATAQLLAAVERFGSVSEERMSSLADLNIRQMSALTVLRAAEDADVKIKSRAADTSARSRSSSSSSSSSLAEKSSRSEHGMHEDVRAKEHRCTAPSNEQIELTSIVDGEAPRQEVSVQQQLGESQHSLGISAHGKGEERRRGGAGEAFRRLSARLSDCSNCCKSGESPRRMEPELR